MVAYTGIQGQNILIVSSDPANPTEGQIWYNSTSNLLKGYANVVVNAWASGGNLNTARIYLAGCGTQNAALAFGGSVAPKTQTEEYNGTAWTNNPTGLNTGRSDFQGCGTQTAGLGVGGYLGPGVSNATEEYDGSTWTNGGNLNTSRYNAAAFGSQTAAVTAGGGAASPVGAQLNATENYNGTSWTSNPTGLNTARRTFVGIGTNTAGLVFGGIAVPGNTNATESWNGTSWTTVNALNIPGVLAQGGSGIQTSAISFGGSTPGGSTAATELWNGTSWTSNPTGLGTARLALGSANGATPSSTALAFGGTVSGPVTLANTEEWTGVQLTTRTLTTS
jgi:hypothetical protein